MKNFMISNRDQCSWKAEGGNHSIQVTVDVDQLQCEIQEKYAEVAETPEKGFHIHTGYRLTGILGYPPDIISRLPVAAVESFAGVGNPWSLGTVEEGWTVSTQAHERGSIR